MGPIVVGTTLKMTVMVDLQNTATFRVSAYIDTPTIISAFSSSRYLYEGLIEGSGITYSDILEYWYSSRFGWGWRVMSADTFDSG